MARYVDIECDAVTEVLPRRAFKTRQDIQDFLDNIPTADVTPVRHGRWICIRKGYGEYECSVCRGVDSNCSDYYGTHVVTEQEYCPNCGAKMDGGAEAR